MTGPVLVLAGTTEAASLCAALRDAAIPAIASLAGATANPKSLAIQTRIGGFGGVDGLVQWLAEQRVSGLVDATHPFAMQMPWIAAEAARRVDLPRLRLLRRPFVLNADWQGFDSMDAAANALPPGSCVFLATGRRETCAMFRRADCTFVLRSIDPAGPVPEHVTALTARPGKDADAEAALFERHAITHLVARDSGGPGVAKLLAAMRMGIHILLIRRPPQPPGDAAESVQDAVAWLRRNVVFAR